MPKSKTEGCYDDKRKLKFLKCLSISSHVTASAKAANVSLSTVYLWRNRDPQFYDCWIRALAAGYELLEMELLDRARNGAEKHIFENGEKVATVREYNDGLAVKLLLAHKQMVALSRAAEEHINSAQVGADLDRKLGDMRTKLLRRRALAEARAKPSPSTNEE